VILKRGGEALFRVYWEESGLYERFEQIVYGMNKSAGL
jgi:hypothetical protein